MHHLSHCCSPSLRLPIASRTELAALMYAIAVEVDSEHAAAAYRLGECLMTLGKPDEAISFLNQSINLSYGNSERSVLMVMAKAKLASILP